MYAIRSYYEPVETVVAEMFADEQDAVFRHLRVVLSLPDYMLNLRQIPFQKSYNFV